MLEVPVNAVANQIVSAVLGGQPCAIHLNTKGERLYVDLYVNNAPICLTRIARNEVKIVRHKYLGFIGDIMFVDMEGVEDPIYTGLGVRFKLVYLEAIDNV